MRSAENIKRGNDLLQILYFLFLSFEFFFTGFSMSRGFFLIFSSFLFFPKGFRSFFSEVMVEDLVKICFKFNLNEDEDEILDLGGVTNDQSLGKIVLIMVGYFVTERNYNFEVFKKIML